VVETSRGGASGGNSRLTELGEELLKTFDDELEKLDRHLAKQNG
jgi:molybdate transport repressor ModE-like protein